MDKNEGKVYLIGAGPGDPGLITLKGKTIIEQCDVIIYDRLASAKMLDFVKKDCRKIYVGKASGNHSMKQEEINQVIIDSARNYRIVVRLKGGDPYVFGRGGEEVLALREQGISYEVIPGITSATAVAAYAGIPITHRGISQSFHVVTGHTADNDTTLPEDLQQLAKLKGTIVILMGLGSLGKIVQELMDGGKPAETPVAVISNGTTIRQKEVRGCLKDICDKVVQAGINAPAIIIVGDSVKEDLRNTKEEVLSGVRIGVTGTRIITEKLTGQLEELGAIVDTVCATKLIEFDNNTEFESALRNLEQYHWLILTSANAVHILFNKMKEMKIDIRKLTNTKVASVGSGTGNALAEYGIFSDYVAKQYNVITLAKALCNLISDGERLLIPRAAQGSDVILEILDSNNIKYDDIKIYDVEEGTEFPEETQDQALVLDYLVFTSATGVSCYFHQGQGSAEVIPEGTKVVCIGEPTEAALREHGYRNAYVAKESSVKGLVERICEIHNSKTIQ